MKFPTFEILVITISMFIIGFIIGQISGHSIAVRETLAGHYQYVTNSTVTIEFRK